MPTPEERIAAFRAQAQAPVVEPELTPEERIARFRAAAPAPALTPAPALSPEERIAKFRQSPELPRLLMDATEGAPTREDLDAAREAKRALREAGDREGAKKLQNSIKFEIQPAIRNAKRAEREAARSGLELTQPEPPDNTTYLEHFINGIDKSGRAGRALANSAFGDPSATFEGIWNNTQGDPEVFLKHMRESKAIPAQVLHKLAQTAGYLPGTILGTLGALEGAGYDLIKGETPSLENMQKTIDYGRDSATQFFELAGADPVSYIGLGAGGAAKTLEGQALKAGLEAGLPKEAAVAFSKEAFKHAPQILGDVHQGEKLAALASKYGVEGSAFANHFGPAGEVAGKTGLANVMESVRSRPDLVAASGDSLPGRVVAKLPGAEKAADIAKAAFDVQDEYRPGYQRQAIRQKVSELRRGAQHGTNAKIAGAIDEGRLMPGNTKALLGQFSKEEREFAKQQFADWAKNSFGGGRGLDPHTADEMVQYFNTGMQGLESGPLAPIMKHWKMVHLSGNPGHLIKDQISDALYGIAGGLKDPRRAVEAIKVNWKGLKDDAVVMKDITGKSHTAGEIRAELQKAGVLHPQAQGPMGHLDMDMVPSAKELARKLEIAQLNAKGAKVRAYLKNTPQVAEDLATLGMGRVGKPWAKKWDELFKTTMYLHYLHEGESPANAIAKMFAVAPDYADPGRFPKMLNFLRKAAPLIGWKYRAMANIPRIALEHPGAALSFPVHLAQALDQPDANAAPKWLREKSLSFQLPGSDKGETQRASFDSPAISVASDVVNPINLLDQIHPLAKIIYEQLAGKDALTDQDMGRLYDPRRQTTRLRLFQPGATHGLLPSLEASPGEFSLSNYADAVLSPQTIALLNKINLLTGGSQGLVGRPLTGQDMGKSNDRKMFNAFTGMDLTPTNPATGVNEKIYAPETKKAAESKGKLKKLKQKKR